MGAARIVARGRVGVVSASAVASWGRLVGRGYSAVVDFIKITSVRISELINMVIEAR